VGSVKRLVYSPQESPKHSTLKRAAVRKQKPGFLELGRRTLFGRPSRPVVPDLPPAPDLAATPSFTIGALTIDTQRHVALWHTREFPLEPTALRLLIMLNDAYPDAVNREHLAVRLFGRGGTFEHRESFQRQLSRLRHVFSLTQVAKIEHRDGDAYALVINDSGNAPQPDPSRPVAEGADALATHSSEPLHATPLIRTEGSTTLHSKKSIQPVGALLAVVVLMLTIALILFIDRKAGTLWGTPEARQVVRSFPIDGHNHPTSDPAFSVDGKTLMFTQWLDDHHSAIVALDLEHLQQKVLTDGTASDRFPRLISQAGQVVFERTMDTGGCAVMRLELQTQTLLKLADCDHNGLGPLTLMPDGAHVTFAHRTADSLPLQLVSVGLNDGVMTGVTNPISGMPGDSQPSLSKDGQTLAFVRTKALGVADLWALSHQSSAAVELTHDLSPLHGISFDFFDQTVVLSSERGGHAGLWRSHLDGFQPDLVLESADELTHPTVHPSGTQIAYTREVPQVHAVEIATTDRLDNSADYAQEHRLREVDCAQDHHACVAVSTEGGHDQLILFSATHERQVLTVSDATVLESPHWTPDGQGIVYTAGHAGQFDLWLYERGQSKPLTHDGNNRSPVFSRDGQKLYFSSRHSGHWQMLQAAWPNFGNPQPLTKTGAIRGFEGMDGSFYYVRPDRAGIWQQPLAGDQDPSLLVPDLSPLDWRLFALTDQGIWYLSRRDSHPPELHYFSFSDGRVTRAIPLKTDLWPASGMTWLPNHHVLVFEHLGSEQHVEVALLQ